MNRLIDNLLNRITMYRLVLYYLIFLLCIAFLLSIVNVFSFDPFALLLTVAFLLGVSVIVNRLFAQTFGVPANVESVYITALILALIISPIQSFNDLWFLGWAAILAMASKYILAIKRKHLFNPAAFAVALTYFTINQSASWWVGSGPMLVFVILGGLLVVRKLGRFDMVLSFLITALVTTWISDLFTGTSFLASTQNILVYSPLIFFAVIILTEPLTTPPTRSLRIVYGALVGFLFAPQFHIGAFFITPEVAILLGNIYSYLVSSKDKLVLKLKEKNRLAPDTMEFVFAAPRRFAFAPGQYMEWTLGHPEADSRGNRRYFTLASSPTEYNLRLGVKFYQQSSTFKKALLALNNNTEVVAAQLSGDFVLPKNSRQKCVFIAGGIGVTPFRSMIKYLLDTHQRRPITLFYSAPAIDDFVYKDVFDRAQQELGIRTVYTVTSNRNVPPSWPGKVGRISPEMIRSVVSDYRSCVFYLSGSRNMVDSLKDTLHRLGVPNHQVKTDYFAGLA
ncbi:MAG TPA: RnfABCDGE type electron transport complex subunit D [Anaerolineales bacterium]|nr:RnfABCDGE type electron transport complex subunit D [Anaerolineales bacterium]